MNKQQTIRAILDAAAEGNLSKVEDALDRYTKEYSQWITNNNYTGGYHNGDSDTNVWVNDDNDAILSNDELYELYYQSIKQ